MFYLKLENDFDAPVELRRLTDKFHDENKFRMFSSYNELFDSISKFVDKNNVSFEINDFDVVQYMIDSLLPDDLHEF